MNKISYSDMKSYIINEINNLDKSDCVDILTIIMSNEEDSDSKIKVSKKGTHLYINKLQNEVIEILYNTVFSKIQRIKNS